MLLFRFGLHVLLTCYGCFFCILRIVCLFVCLFVNALSFYVCVFRTKSALRLFSLIHLSFELLDKFSRQEQRVSPHYIDLQSHLISLILSLLLVFSLIFSFCSVLLFSSFVIFFLLSFFLRHILSHLFSIRPRSRDGAASTPSSYCVSSGCLVHSAMSISTFFLSICGESPQNSSFCC